METICKLNYRTVFVILIGLQAFSISINIISLCDSDWLNHNGIVYSYSGASHQSLYDEYCVEENDEDNFQECKLILRKLNAGLAYISISSICMLLTLIGIYLNIKALSQKYYIKTQIYLLIFCSILYSLGSWYYVFQNTATYSDLFGPSGKMIIYDYYYQAGDGPKLTVVLAVLNVFLMVSTFVIQCIIDKKRSDSLKLNEPKV